MDDPRDPRTPSGPSIGDSLGKLASDFGKFQKSQAATGQKMAESQDQALTDLTGGLTVFMQGQQAVYAEMLSTQRDIQRSLEAVAEPRKAVVAAGCPARPRGGVSGAAQERPGENPSGAGRSEHDARPLPTGSTPPPTAEAATRLPAKCP